MRIIRILVFFYTWFKIKILNLIFPISCINCGKDDILICNKCLLSIPKKLNSFRLSSDFWVHVTYDFKVELVKKLIIRAKYYASPIIFEDLTLYSIVIFSPIFNVLRNKETILIPVPLYFIRKRKRGFNQSLIIANIIANNFENIQVLELVKRVKNTSQQAKLNKNNRLKNLNNSMKIDKNVLYTFLMTIDDIKNYNFIIIDDVVSTGATLISVKQILEKDLNILSRDIVAISLCKS